MKDIPGTEYIHLHKKTGLYQITRRVNRVLKSYGYGKTLIIALMKRDWVIHNNWTPYPRVTKTNEKYIQIKDNHYKVMKRIKGRYKTYGSFETLEEAIKYRDFIISKGWSSNYKYKNPMRYIYLNSRKTGYIISKYVNGEQICFGSFKTLEDAQKERDLLEKCEWDFDKLCEHDNGERAYLDGKLNTRIQFEKHHERRDWY